MKSLFVVFGHVDGTELLVCDTIDASVRKICFMKVFKNAAMQMGRKILGQ